MTLKQKLFKTLPKKYHKLVDSIEPEFDLCDGCKYMLYFVEEYSNTEVYGGSFAVRNITEAIEIIKELAFELKENQKF